MGDIVYINGGVVGRVERFWLLVAQNLLQVQLTVYPPDPSDPGKKVLVNDGGVAFIEVGEIVDALIWAPATPNMSIRIILPFILHF